MLRLFAAVIVLSCFTTSASAQAQPAPQTGATLPAQPTAKSATRKPAARSQPAGRQAAGGSGSCGLGVVIVVGDEFTVKTIGLTRWQSKETVAPINWGLEDLIFARVRAAAPGLTVIKIPYVKSRFPERDKPKNELFRDERAELADHMRKVTEGTNCQRYVWVGNSVSRFGTSGYTVRGIGIVNHDVLVGHRIYFFALSYIRVFDGRDFSIIKHGSALTHIDPLLKRVLLGTLILGPYSELAEASFPDKPEDATTNLAFREYARAFLTASLDRTLPYMLRP
jgi:hypothetical protein